MYMVSCDTQSQPRKAISHIFGRNKLCTRSIPDNVWVHYCRKHYQRSRYRNAQEYARIQCDLVANQVSRVQIWSDKNQRENRPGVVQNWSLSIRKREQKRLDDKSANKKRKYDDEEEDDDPADRAQISGTAVPDWLLNKCNTGYSTAQINAIVDELRVRMDAGELTQIPDIEILPNVLTDASDETKTKTYPKRKASTSSHKRSQSVGVSGLRPQLNDPYTIGLPRRIAQPSTGGYWGEDPYANNAAGIHSLQKRPRMGSQEELYGINRGGIPNMPPRNMERTVPNMRRPSQMQHRPTFPDIRETQAEDRFYDDRQSQVQPGNGTYTFGGPTVSGPHGPLPAPTPQRHAGTPMAEQLEPAQQPQSYHDIRARPTHQRAYSDASNIYHPNAQMNYRPSSAGYTQCASTAPNGYAPAVPTPSYTPMPQPQSYDATGATGYMGDYMRPSNDWADPSGPPGYYDDLPQRQHQASQATYPTGPSQQQQQQAYYPSPGAPSSMAPNGAAKHMRHQSQPVMPPRQMRSASYSTVSPGPGGPNHYSLPVSGPSYGNMPCYDQGIPAAAMNPGYGGHQRHQSAFTGMPRVDEMDPSREMQYMRR
jgi:hypothetical protein